MTHPVDPKVIEAEENLLIDFQFLLQEVMTEKKVSRSELADKAGLSKARLTQILGSEANPTVKSMARLFHALDEQICLSRKPILIEEKTPNPAVAKPTEWKWARAASLEHKKDDKELTQAVKASLRELARTVKESFASNDNRTPHESVMIIPSEVALAPESEAA